MSTIHCGDRSGRRSWPLALKSNCQPADTSQVKQPAWTWRLRHCLPVFFVTKKKKESCRSTETCISLNWSVLDVINSVTRGKNVLMEGFLWKGFSGSLRASFLMVNQEIKRLCCSSHWFSACLLPKLDLNCAESPADAPHEQICYLYIQTGHLHGAAQSHGAHWLCWTLAWARLHWHGLLSHPLLYYILPVCSLPYFKHIQCQLSYIFFVNCIMPSVSLLLCITKRKQFLATYDYVCVCACNLFSAA